MNGLRLALLDLSAKPTSKRPEPLSGADAAEDFFRSLPRADPIVSQRLLCDVLAPIGGGSDPDIGQLRALVVLDRRAQALLDRLMTDYLALGAQSSDREPQLRQAALELSRSFASGYDFFLRYMRDKNPGVAWLRRLSAILVQLFKHREVELLLSLFRYEPWPRGHWRDL